ncbi:MAG: trigger factor [Phycisphaeraceae bacterium]
MAEQDKDNPTPATPATDTPDATDAATEAKPEQSVAVEDVGPARKKLVIEIPESRIAGKIEESYGKLRDEAVLPGFRRGRAPRRLIERRFGESVRDDVKGQLLSEAYSQAIEDESLAVIGEPDVKDLEQIELPKSGPLKFEVEVEISPEVALPAFEELKVEKQPTAVTDEDIQKEIDRVRERMGEPRAVEGEPVQADDFVIADVKVHAGADAGQDAEVLIEQSGTHVWVAGESREFRGHVVGIVVDDLGQRLAGKTTGDEEVISTTGPAGHEDERIKDQPITIRLKITGVERIEPASVDQLVQRMGVESEQALRDRAREMLEQRSQQEQQEAMHKQVTDQLLEKVEMELPEDMTTRQTDRVLSRRRMELAYEGKGEHEVEQEIAELRAGSEEEAKRQLKLFFIIDQAAKDLEIEVAESEINGRITMMAMRQGRRPEKLRQELHARGELEHIYMQMREHKTLDAILAKVQVEEKAGDEKPADEKPAE